MGYCGDIIYHNKSSELLYENKEKKVTFWGLGCDKKQLTMMRHIIQLVVHTYNVHGSQGQKYIYKKDQ